MTDKQLISNLKELKNKKLDNTFLKENRDLLLSQISNSGAESISPFRKFLISFENLAKASARPAISIATFVAVLLTAGVFGNSYLERTKPNDTLYIARVLSEKVKVNTTFDEGAREKLASRYALSHAEDIVTILSDDNFHSEENSEQIAKLNEDFKTEINRVSLGINSLETNNQENNAENNEENITSLIIKEDSNLQDKEISSDDLVVIVENNKDENGIEVASVLIEEDNEEDSIKMEIAEVEGQLKGTSSKDIYTEITELFEQKKFEEARVKLNMLKEILQ